MALECAGACGLGLSQPQTCVALKDLRLRSSPNYQKSQRPAMATLAAADGMAAETRAQAELGSGVLKMSCGVERVMIWAAAA